MICYVIAVLGYMQIEASDQGMEVYDPAKNIDDYNITYNDPADEPTNVAFHAAATEYIAMCDVNGVYQTRYSQYPNHWQTTLTIMDQIDLILAHDPTITVDPEYTSKKDDIATVNQNNPLP